MSEDRELRLALVCYGGISLAVYMHGITREIWHLARASRAFCDGHDLPEGSEALYHELLAEIEAETGIRQRVLVDIIAGASAGGINGIFLAQAIATGQSLDPLTDLWLDRADIEALLDPQAAPHGVMSKAWARPIAWLMMGRGDAIDGTVDATARDEVRSKLERFVRARWFEPPFGGPAMLNMLLDAFDAMAATSGERLLPVGQPLDLFVTVTDFGGHPEILALNSPPEVIETEHRLVFGFTDRGTGLAHPAELAFAARATSSFPGAFPPFCVGELDRVLAERKVEWAGRDAFLHHALPRQAAVGAAERAVLIDGSVLANAPFRPAVDALRERPARRQVDRRFVYIDPTPGRKIAAVGAEGNEAPGFFQTILGAVSELPRQQPIRDNLEAIGQRSARIERMLTIVERIRAEVETQVEQLFGYTLFLDFPTPARLAAWRARSQRSAASKAGYGNAAYGLLKIDGVLDRLADLLGHVAGDIAPDRIRHLRADLETAVRRAGADQFTGHSPGASPATLLFLRTHDVGFRIRRLRLVARRVTELDANFEKDELLPFRDAVYQSLADYLECERTDRFVHLKDAVARIGDDAATVLDRVGEAMNLQALDAATDARLSAALSTLSREARRPLLLAYLGFPFYDLATLPLLQGEGSDEFDPIRVDRIAPDDATSIRSGGAEATLKGIQFNCFGAFFSRAYRENDYLWGRLHGAERLIDIVLSTLPAAKRLKPGRATAIKRAIFHAILDAEEARLTAIPGLFESLRREIG